MTEEVINTNQDTRIVGISSADGSSSSSLDSIDVKENKEPTEPLELSGNNFFIIVSSSKDESSIQAKAKEIGAVTIKTDDFAKLNPGYYSVVFGPYNSKDEADKAQKEKAIDGSYIKDGGKGTFVLPSQKNEYDENVKVKWLKDSESLTIDEIGLIDVYVNNYLSNIENEDSYVSPYHYFMENFLDEKFRQILKSEGVNSYDYWKENRDEYDKRRNEIKFDGSDNLKFVNSHLRFTGVGIVQSGIYSGAILYSTSRDEIQAYPDVGLMFVDKGIPYYVDGCFDTELFGIKKKSSIRINDLYSDEKVNISDSDLSLLKSDYIDMCGYNKTFVSYRAEEIVKSNTVLNLYAGSRHSGDFTSYFSYNKDNTISVYNFTFPSLIGNSYTDTTGEGVLNFTFNNGVINKQEYDLFTGVCGHYPLSYHTAQIDVANDKWEDGRSRYKKIGSLDTGEGVFIENVEVKDIEAIDKTLERISTQRKLDVAGGDYSYSRKEISITADIYRLYLNKMEDREEKPVLYKEFVESTPILLVKEPIFGRYIIFRMPDYIYQSPHGCDW